MKWPWQFGADVRAKREKADAQAEQAKGEYERTVKSGGLVLEVWAAVRYHAEKNSITESIQKVARGH